jgi:hypothetical protein
MLSLVTAPAFPATASLDSATVMETVTRLKPGEFLWAPDLAPEGPVLIIISLANQRAIVYRNGLPIGITTVSTGRPGHETPTGLFTILQKQIDHRSSLYNDAPMPYMQRLTWGGVALHGGTLPGYAASHGCIRLPADFAKLLYGVTRLGLTVVITNDEALPRVAPLPEAQSPTASELDVPALAGPSLWAPERSPTGPISIVISTADGQMMVLRNGREIGASLVTIRRSVERTEAFVLRGKDAAALHWLRVPIAGGPVAQPSDAPAQEPDLAGVPVEFRRRIFDILTPGATMLITNDSLAKTGTQRSFVVMTADKP